MTDGSIAISTELDNKELEKQLRSLTKQIERAEGTLSKKTGTQSALKEKLEAAKQAALETETAIKRLTAEEASLKAGTSTDGGTLSPEAYIASIQRQKEITEELGAQEALLAKQDKETERIANQYTKAVDAVKTATEALDRQKEKAGAIVEELAAVNNQTSVMGPAIQRADAYMERFVRRVKGLARRVLVFSIITMALRSLRTWMGKVIKTNGEAAAALAKLKGALLTLAQPLVNIIIPAFTTFVNVLTQLITSVAKVLSMLFGGTIEQSRKAAEELQDETAALEGIGGAADKAGKSIASFDEINQLSGDSSGSGGGAASSEIVPHFDFDPAGADGFLKAIEAIGAALLAWKVSSALHSGLKGFLGMLLAIYSAVEFVKNLFDAWVNSVSWDNLRGMLLGAIGLAAGLAMAIGPVAAGISLIVTGLAMLMTGFHDAFQNGWTLQNLLLSIAGILGAGIGIGILTKSWVPLLVAAITGILLAITAACGEGGQLLGSVKEMLQGFLDFFKGTFTGNLALAIQGIGGIFGGLNGVFQAVLNALTNMINSFLDWLDEKTRGKLRSLIEWIRGFLSGHIMAVKELLGNLTASVQEIFTGLAEFISGVFTNDWALAWQGVTDVFRGIWNTIVSILEAGINFIINGINFFIDGCNRAFGIIRALTGYPPEIPSIQAVELPRLAAGAVIPPNREFLAVLGDQKRGTNIEAPLETIVQAVMLALARSGGNGGGQVIENVVNLDGEVIYRNQQKVSRRHGKRLANK